MRDDNICLDINTIFIIKEFILLFNNNSINITELYNKIKYIYDIRDLKNNYNMYIIKKLLQYIDSSTDNNIINLNDIYSELTDLENHLSLQLLINKKEILND